MLDSVHKQTHDYIAFREQSMKYLQRVSDGHKGIAL